MNIIKLGGSLVFPDEGYNYPLIDQFIAVAKNSKEKFMFVIGGGKLCRIIQNDAKKTLQKALHDQEETQRALDELGIATTKINAFHLLQRFQQKLGAEVYPQLILDPTAKVTSTHRIFFAGGVQPGHSTDTDMMLLAKTFSATKVFKISSTEIIRNISPLKVYGIPEQQRREIIRKAPELPAMTWKQLRDLVGNVWKPGLNTPFDPPAVEIGYSLRKQLTLYVGRLEEFPNMIADKPFRGTIVKG